MKEKSQEYKGFLNKMASFFCKEYFNTKDYHWLNDNVGGILVVSDYYLDADILSKVVKYRVSKNLLPKEDSQ